NSLWWYGQYAHLNTLQTLAIPCHTIFRLMASYNSSSARTLQLSASCQCHGQEYWDGQRCFSLVPAGGTWDKDGMISSPAASERYPSKKQERFLSLVPAVRIVRVHVLPSTADSEHVSDTEWYGIA
ncbi:hypothetical protein PV326_013206, partial [Microctonus aethiopoides]